MSKKTWTSVSPKKRDGWQTNEKMPTVISYYEEENLKQEIQHILEWFRNWQCQLLVRVGTIGILHSSENANGILRETVLSYL